MTQRTSFAKLQRARDKQAAAAAKRVRRQERSTAEPADETAPSPLLDGTGDLSAAELLTLVESVHQQFEAGLIEFEAFEETKLAILSRLPID